MKGLIIAVVIIVGLALIGVLIVISGLNKVVTLDEAATKAWSDVENQYQRRFDLIPNLVETVKGVAGFEKETYTAVTEARAKVGQIKVTPEMLSDPGAFGKFQAAQDGLSGALSRLLVTVENYPELKASENFQTLQAQLEGTENRIAVERRRYNESARRFNTYIRKIPGMLWATMRGLTTPKEYFKAAAGAEEAPRVKF
ncbi:MAG: LemA family protein [Candidatus Auribacterota bacterium]|nr:LemA family protein [Candidatus Auribacterota bacterium]